MKVPIQRSRHYLDRYREKERVLLGKLEEYARRKHGKDFIVDGCLECETIVALDALRKVGP